MWLVDEVTEILGYVCLPWSIDNEVDHTVGGTYNSGREKLKVGDSVIN